MSKENMTLFFDDGGAGSVPVIFLHSLAGNHQQWSAQLAHIRLTRRALAVDLRGHGQSPLPTNDNYTIEAIVEDVQAVVTQLGIQTFVLVGHSMGGAVAAAYAGKYPQQVAGLLLVDPSGDSTQMPKAQVQQYMAAMQSEGYGPFIEGYWNHILTGATEATQTQVMQDLGDTAQETVTGIFEALFTFNPATAVQQYDGPILSVITPLNEIPFALHKLVPNLPHVLMTDTGHWLHMDKPDAFNKILDDFLATV